MTTTGALPSCATVRALLDYDPATGIFTWKRTGRRAGGPAGENNSYWLIGIDYVRYYAHRLAWLWMTGKAPEQEVDHRDRDALNNRWSNLREATSSQNKHNRGVTRRSRSGVKGVHWNERDQKWEASLMVDYKRTRLGNFDSIAEAAAAYRSALASQTGEFARFA